jgi:hypothetical protein
VAIAVTATTYKASSSLSEGELGSFILLSCCERRKFDTSGIEQQWEAEKLEQERIEAERLLPVRNKNLTKLFYRFADGTIRFYPRYLSVLQTTILLESFTHVTSLSIAHGNREILYKLINRCSNLEHLCIEERNIDFSRITVPKNLKSLTLKTMVLTSTHLSDLATFSHQTTSITLYML